MAVIPTGAIYKALIFDGESSRNYGVYITGEAVYNSPERDVEMIKIPGRNGEFALDNGRFQNIEVTYPAGIFADSETDFAAAISDFRNFLASRVGYCRLEDEYNPNEYRMAVYKSGLNVDPAKLEAGEFDITFDCKPQRWLKDGETAVTMASGDTLTNPTLFESSPLLETAGSGSIQFNGYEIGFEGIPYGEVLLSRRYGEILPLTDAWSRKLLSSGLDHLMTGDAIYPSGSADERLEVVGRLKKTSTGIFANGRVTSTSNVLDAKFVVVDYSSTGNGYRAHMYVYPDFGSGFVYGTPKTITSTATFSYSIGSTNYTETLVITINYNGTDTITVSLSMSGTLPAGTERLNYVCNGQILYGFSTEPLQGIPIFIDCDLGEAYIVEDGVYKSLNQYIDLGSDLPTLGVGANEVTFDNTITELKVTPRWWKV